MSRASCTSRTSWLALGLMLGPAPAALMAQQSPPAAAAASAAPAPAQAQAATAEPPVDDDDAIIVQGIKPRGSVEGDIKPEQTLSLEDIEALGVGNVGDLIDALITQIGATDGPAPVTLLNGKRISGRQEINDIPSEAISRTEILPAEVALAYGYPADQKVFNIVLVPAFRAFTATGNYSMATRGGRESPGATGSLQTIAGDNRLNITLNARQSAKLLESQRNITTIPSNPQYAIGGNIYGTGTGCPDTNGQADPRNPQIDPALSALAGPCVASADVPDSAATGAPALASFVPGANKPAISDLGDFRTLQGQSRQYSANVTYSRALGGVSTTINGQLQRNQTLSLQGLSTAGFPGASLLIPAGSPFSPFSQPVRLYRYLPEADALSQRGKTTTARLGATLFGQITGSWNWNFTGSYNYSNSRTTTNRGIDSSALQAAITANNPTVNPFGTIGPTFLTLRPLDTGNSISNNFEGTLLINGTPFRLPAGPVRVSGSAGYSSNDQSSRSVRSGITTLSGFHRNTISGRASLTVPLTSRREGFLDVIGDLSANANYVIQHVSDFGGRTSYGYGLTWSPITGIQLRGSMNNTLTPPNPSQLNGQQIVTPNVAVFDNRTGTTVFVTRISGANPDLLASYSHRLMLSATIRPLSTRDWTLNANYSRNRSSNVVQNLPTQSPAIEAAFPDRFVRPVGCENPLDTRPQCALISIDTRPVNYARTETAQLRWGISLAFFLGKAPPPPPPRAPGGRGAQADARGGRGDAAGVPAAPAAAASDGAIIVEGTSPPEQAAGRGGRGGFQPGARPPGGGGRGGFGAAGGGGRGRGGGGLGAAGRPQLRLEFFHIWRFTDTVLIRPGLPIIDNLNGGATNGRGQPRHRLQANASLNYRGFGGRVETRWDSATSTNGALGGTSTLRFAAQTNANLSFFANFGRMPKLVAKIPFLKGTRLNLNVNNVLDTHQKVTDATGATPIQYEADRINPVGRTVAVTLRKQF